MALKFYFDTHIAKVAAEQLRAKGITVIRCEEVDMASASDEEHLQYATDNGCIMVSQDADFPVLHSQWSQKNKKHAGIFKLPSGIQGDAQISLVVNMISFYAESEDGGAVDYEAEIENILIYF